jgi:folate-binding protein YgfZ
VTGTSDYRALTEGAAFIDLSSRGRLCLIGADRQQFLNGQVTNNVKTLKVGQGCYAALANNKGRMAADLNIFILQDEILLDFEPGLADAVKTRLEKFIIADDVEVVDASGYRLLCLSGPRVSEIAQTIGLPTPAFFNIEHHGAPNADYVASTPRFGTTALDIFSPGPLDELKGRLLQAGVPEVNPESVEALRIENGVPRFGIDMDENTLVPEAIEQAISYNKGCYIGQEVIARIRTYGQVAKALRGLRFEKGAPLPKRGDKILNDGKEVGAITSGVFSPRLQRAIALGYVRKECNQIGTRLTVNELPVEIVPIPFQT